MAVIHTFINWNRISWPNHIFWSNLNFQNKYKCNISLIAWPNTHSAGSYVISLSPLLIISPTQYHIVCLSPICENLDYLIRGSSIRVIWSCHCRQLRPCPWQNVVYFLWFFYFIYPIYHNVYFLLWMQMSLFHVLRHIMCQIIFAL